VSFERHQKGILLLECLLCGIDLRCTLRDENVFHVGFDAVPLSLVSRHRRKGRGIKISMALTCREFIESLIDYSSGELDPGQYKHFEAHLLWCRNCAVYLSTYKATVRLSKGAFQYSDEAQPAPIPDDLVQAILAARLSTRNRPPPS
jgi:hypothetical protein